MTRAAPRRVCVFTGTRAEYGLLRRLMGHLRDDPRIDLRLLVSGMHLSAEFGTTVGEIEADGYEVHERVEILLSSDTPIGICKSIGLGLIGYSEALERQRPDLLVVLGDRFEAFAVASAATVCAVPIAHLHGGEVTRGAIDEPMRHAITKMSHLHFTSTEPYRLRVIQMGEDPARVFNVGALGVENALSLDLLDPDELERQIGFGVREPFLLVTFHPATLEPHTAEQHVRALFAALDELGARAIFTKANADAEGRAVNRSIDEYVRLHAGRCAAFESMGVLRYLSAMRSCSAVVGNSSSGILEAPAFRVPSVNVGDRQLGRVRPASVIDCPPETPAIRAAIERASSADFRQGLSQMVNPYEGPAPSRAIAEAIAVADLENIRKKEFYDLPRR